jgi:hypothetical protein
MLGYSFHGGSICGDVICTYARSHDDPFVVM